MRRLYESKSRSVRAAQHRLDARECEIAGFPTIAWYNRAMAEFLDPIREDDEAPAR